jgi:hypothetical protein
MMVGRPDIRHPSVAFSAAVLCWLAGCSSSHMANPPPDPEFVEAARAERERLALEREQAAAARAELERVALAIEREPHLLSQDELAAILEYRCGDCHFPEADASGDGEGMYYMDDLARMINERKVIPGDGEGSRLVLRMREGSMPPLTSGDPPVPMATIDRIVDFIDTLQPPPSED